MMYLMNYQLYSSEARMPRILAEDAGIPELRDPVFCIRTKFRFGKIRRARKAADARCCVCQSRLKVSPAY